MKQQAFSVLQIHAVEKAGEIYVASQNCVMRQDPKAKDNTLHVWFRELRYVVFSLAGCDGFVLPFLVCFFFLDSQVQSQGEKKKRKENLFALWCWFLSWDFMKGCLRSHLCLVHFLLPLINLNHGPSRNQNSINFSCLFHCVYTKDSIMQAVFFLVSAKNWLQRTSTGNQSIGLPGPACWTMWKITPEYCDPWTLVR